MKPEVSLFPMWHNKAVLVYETSKPNHATKEVLVVYSAHEVVVGGGW